jgi:hypothetical protein
LKARGVSQGVRNCFQHKKTQQEKNAFRRKENKKSKENSELYFSFLFADLCFLCGKSL